MNAKHIKKPFAVSMYIMVMLAVIFSAATPAQAADSSPFVGHWQAIDLDGSDMDLSIGGPPDGPFRVSWRDSYISFCNGEPGIIRGTGQLNEGDPNLLEADLRLTCFTTGESLNFHLTWRYHPATSTLSSRYDNGMVTIWYQPGRPLPPPPMLNLRVNYGHDWAESFYEAGHMAWVTLTGSDGVTVKATAELITEPKDYWGGEPGFQTLDSIWLDTSGNPMENPPDIQPNDWVFGWVDNGASAQVQIGDISGTITLADDSIAGTILAPWFTEPVSVECLDWGSGGEPFPNKDGGFVLTNGADPYSCSWAGEWDIQAGQTVGVGYFDPDGNWVANAFSIPQLVLYVHYEYPDVVEGSYELGHSIQVTVFDSDGTIKATASTTTIEMPHWGGGPGFRVEQWDGMDGPPDIQPGDVVRAVVDDGFLTAEVRIGEIAATVDLAANSITGTIAAEWAGELVEVACLPWGGPAGTSEKYTTVVPDGSSQFTCTWDAGEWDIQPGEPVGVAYYGSDLHYVANVVPNPWVVAFPEVNQVFGYGWPVGSEVNLTINGEDIATTTVQGAPWDENDIMAFFDFGGLHDLAAGDSVRLFGSGMERTHLVQNLAVTVVDMETDTVSGTADSGATVHAWVHGFGQDVWLTVEDGLWTASFGSDGFQLEPGMCGRAEIPGEGYNSTGVDWCIPNPSLTAFPADEYIEGWNWALGATIHLSIDDPATGANPDFEQDQPVVVTPWDPNAFWVTFNFSGEYDMKPGDTVTLSDGVTSRSHTIRNVTITAVDQAANTVAGTAETGAQVHAWVHGFFNETEMQFTVEDGTWLADFGAMGFDLVEGLCGRAEIRDEIGNSSAADWCIPVPPAPVIFAHPAYNYVEGTNWTPGTGVTITIDDPNDGEGVDYSDTQTVAEDTWVRFPLSGFDLQAGHQVTMTDGQFTQTMVVSSLRVAGFYLDTQTVFGVGDPGSEVLVADNGMVVPVGDTGNWSATFAELLPGTWWTVIQIYPDGNEVRETFRVPEPRIAAHPAYNFIEGREWTPGAEVTITIDDPANGEGVDYTQTAIASGNINYLYDTTVQFQLGFDLQAGHQITMTDGHFTQTMVVSSLRVTGFDLDTHTVFGVGDPGSEILVADNGMVVPVNDAGNWSATFAELLPGTWWTVIQIYPDGNEVKETFYVE